METYQLKKIIIIILALVNLSLLALLGRNELQQKNAELQMLQQLQTLYASNGIDLSLNDLPSRASAVSALASSNAEKEEALARQEELLMIKEDLTAEYANISSAQYIERLARRDLKLVKSNELLFILPDRETVKAADNEENGEEDGKTED